MPYQISDSTDRMPVLIFGSQERFKRGIDSAQSVADLELAFAAYMRGYEFWKAQLSDRQRRELAEQFSSDASAIDVVGECLGVATKSLGAVADLTVLAYETYDLSREIARDGWIGFARWSAPHAAEKAADTMWARFAERLEHAWRKAGYAASRDQRRWRRVVERLASSGAKVAGASVAPVMCGVAVMQLFSPFPQGLSDHAQAYKSHKLLLEAHASRQFDLMSVQMGFRSLGDMMMSERWNRRGWDHLLRKQPGPGLGPSLRLFR
jgi:hypothetical protein